MKLKVVLTISAIYLAVFGLGLMFAPRQIGIDAFQRMLPQHRLPIFGFSVVPFLGLPF
jgi:hypothetical protein